MYFAVLNQMYFWLQSTRSRKKCQTLTSLACAGRHASHASRGWPKTRGRQRPSVLDIFLAVQHPCFVRSYIIRYICLGTFREYLFKWVISYICLLAVGIRCHYTRAQARLAALGLEEKRTAAMRAKHEYDATVGRLEPLQAEEADAVRHAAVVEQQVQDKVRFWEY